MLSEDKKKHAVTSLNTVHTILLTAKTQKPLMKFVCSISMSRIDWMLHNNFSLLGMGSSETHGHISFI